MLEIAKLIGSQFRAPSKSISLIAVLHRRTIDLHQWALKNNIKQTMQPTPVFPLKIVARQYASEMHLQLFRVLLIPRALQEFVEGIAGQRCIQTSGGLAIKLTAPGWLQLPHN